MDSQVLSYANTLLLSVIALLVGVIAYFLKYTHDILTGHTKQIAANDIAIVKIQADIEAIEKECGFVASRLSDISADAGLARARIRYIANCIQNAAINGWKTVPEFKLPNRNESD